MNTFRGLCWSAAITLLGPALLSAQVGPKGPAAGALAGTEWTGTEDLAGYGKLTFRFSSGGKVKMIDAKATSLGRYGVERDTVILAFAGGDVVYTGKIKGNVMNGEALDTKLKPWKWRVARRPGGVMPDVTGTPEPGPGGPDPIPSGFDPVAPLPPKGPFEPALAPPADPFLPPKAPAGAVKITPENLPELLKSIGYKPEVILTEAGPPLCVLRLEKDGWKYKVEVSLKGGLLWLTVPLVEVPRDKAASARLLQILEANLSVGPCFFCYRSGDNRLCLRLEVINPNPTTFNGHLSLLMAKTRDTNSLWQPSVWR